MGITLSSRRTVSAELELGFEKHKITATCRVMTPSERAEFRAAAAAAQAESAASNPQDKAALAALGGQREFTDLFGRLCVRCVLDLVDADGEPLRAEVEGGAEKAWRDMSEDERLSAQRLGLEALTREVFQIVNQQPEPRLLGK